MKLLRTLALVALLPLSALAAAPMTTVQPVDGSGLALGTPSNPLYVSGGGGGGGSSGPAFVGQYNSSLPTFASGQAGYLSVDGNGRVLISPSSFPATQTVAGTVTVNQGSAGGAAWPVSFSGQAVNADVRFGGAGVTSANPLPVAVISGGGGGGGATGSVTAAGTNGTTAQAVQGITGGVPLNGFTGQFNTSLPTFANGQTGYLAVDSNGRQILSPSSVVSVSNFPATQAVTLSGQSVNSDLRVAGAAVASGNPIPVNVVGGGGSGSSGSITAAGTNGTTAQAIQGITGGIAVGVYPAQYSSTLPTMASGALGNLQVDSSGRLLLAPTSSVNSDLRVSGAAVATGNPIPVNIVSGGSSGAAGSVTAAGTNGTTAQAVQGITGGIPQNGFVGQYNATLPTFTSAQVGYVAIDSNGRQILSPSSSVSVSNFPATQTVAWSGQSVNSDLRVSGSAVATANPIPVNIVSGGSSGAAGSVTAAGTNGTQAQAVQGITGGIPLNSFPAQYNSTLPTLANAATGYLSADVNGRLLLAPTSSISVSNFPASQAVTNAGTFAVQNTAAVVGGNTTAVKTDGSAVTQPISAASLPLPTGAATAANQNSTAAGTSATNAQAVQGVTGGVAMPISAASLPLPTGAATAANQSSEIAALGTTADAAYAGSGSASIVAGLKGVYNATLAPLAAGTNTIGSIANISGTVSLPTGAATAANQSSEIAALTAIQQRAVNFIEASSQSVAASATYSGTIRDLGPTPAYTRTNAAAYSSQAGTLSILACLDSGCAAALTIASQAVTAGGSGAVSAPVYTRYWRVTLTNGATAGTVSIVSTQAAN